MQPRISTARRHGTPALLVAIVLLVALVGAVSTPSIDYVATDTLIMTGTVVGLYLFVGTSGIFSFGHVGLMAVGGYTSGLLSIPVEKKALLLPDLPGFLASTTLSPPVAVLAGGVAAMVVAAVFAVPLSRLAGLTAALGTLAMLFIVDSVASNWTAVTNGGAGLGGFNFATDRSMALTFAIAAIVGGWLFQESRAGLRIRASREDEHAARAIGVSVGAARALAFVISAFVVGIGGGLLAHEIRTVTPEAFFLPLTFLTLAMLVVGGIGSLSGAVVGAVVLAIVGEVLSNAAADQPGVREVGLAVVMLVALVLRPRGLMGGREITLPDRCRLQSLAALRRERHTIDTKLGEADG